MPMMPIEPAKAVMMVRPFLVMRLLKESDSAVSTLMDERCAGPSPGCPSSAHRASASSPSVTGRVSPAMRPSLMRTMRVA